MINLIQYPAERKKKTFFWAKISQNKQKPTYRNCKVGEKKIIILNRIQILYIYI